MQENAQVQTFQDLPYIEADALIQCMTSQFPNRAAVPTDVQQILDNTVEAMQIGFLVMNIEIWLHNRNLHQPEYQVAQLKKLFEEAEELEHSVLSGGSCLDDCGDVIVVAIGAAMRNGNSALEALGQAFNDIKDRKGRMIDGVFVKEQDL